MRISFILFVIVLFIQASYGQEPRRYAPTQLLKFEYKIFNSLYTTKKFDGFSNLNSRSSYFNTYGQLLFGTGPNWALGTDIVYHARLENDLEEHSPFTVLRFKEERKYSLRSCDHINTSQGPFCSQTFSDTLRNGSFQTLRTESVQGISYLGPKFRWKPFKKLEKFAVQQTLYIPLQKRLDQNWVSFTQLFFEHFIRHDIHLFAELSFWNKFTSSTFEPNVFAKLFLSYFAGNDWTLYATTSIPVEYGLGLKYLINPQLEIELLSTVFIPFEWYNSNRASTFNFGFRYSL